MVEFVRITASNISLLNHVAADVFDEDISPIYLSDYLSNPGNMLIIAVENELVVGHVRAIIHKQPDRRSELFIDNLGVTPLSKRTGIATSLMKHIIDWGKEFGCNDIWLATELDNEEAVGFYNSLGLRATKVVMFANFDDE